MFPHPLLTGDLGSARVEPKWVDNIHTYMRLTDALRPQLHLCNLSAFSWPIRDSPSINFGIILVCVNTEAGILADNS